MKKLFIIFMILFSGCEKYVYPEPEPEIKYCWSCEIHSKQTGLIISKTDICDMSLEDLIQLNKSKEIDYSCVKKQ